MVLSRDTNPLGKRHRTAGRLHRVSGATHSFRLTPTASGLVNAITNPRKYGGKSRKVSDAIEHYFSPRGDNPSYADLLTNIAVLQTVITKQGQELEELRQFPRTGQITQNEGQKNRQSEPQGGGIWVKLRNLWAHN
jgi:hypothetical protein